MQARRALGPQGPGETGGAEPGSAEPVGGAWRHVREEGARCSGSAGTRSSGGWRACLPAHVCVIFEMECVAGRTVGAWGRPRRRRDAARPALPRPPRVLFARKPGWPVTRFPHCPQVRTTHPGGEILALPKQLQRPRAQTEKERCLLRVLLGFLPSSPEQSKCFRYTPVPTPGPQGGHLTPAWSVPLLQTSPVLWCRFSGCVARTIYE